MSKFDKLFEARDGAVHEEPVAIPKKNAGKAQAVKPKKEKPAAKVAAGSDLGDEQQQQAIAEPPSGGKQRGRPKAKRSNPDFIGFTTYIRKDTHLKVKILLLQEGAGREMSELVEELLSGWIKKR